MPDYERLKDQALEYTQKGEPEKALHIYNKLLEDGEPDPLIYWYRGENHHILGNYDKAFSDLDIAVKQTSGHPGPLTGMANLYIAQNKIKPALEILDMVINFSGDKFPPAYLARADCYSKLPDEGGKVIQDLEKFTELVPNEVSVRLRLASVYSKHPIGLDRAQKHLTQVLIHEPNNIEAQTMLANLKIQTGQGKEGESALRKLIETEPDEPRNYARLASLLLSFRKFREAEELLQQAEEVCQRTGKLPPFLKFVEAQLAFFYSQFSESLQKLNEYSSLIKSIEEDDRFDLPPSQSILLFEARLYFWRFFEKVQDIEVFRGLLPKTAILSDHQIEEAIKTISQKVDNDDLRESFKRVIQLKRLTSREKIDNPLVTQAEDDLLTFIISCQKGKSPVKPVFDYDREEKGSDSS